MTSSLKIQSNESLDVKTLSYFQRSFFGKLYKKYLREIPFVRGSTLWAWKRLFPFGMKLYSKLRSEKFSHTPLIKFSQYVVDPKILYSKKVVVTPMPDVFPKYLRHHLLQPHKEYDFPEIVSGIVENAIVTGASNLIDVNDYVVCHDLINFNLDYTSEELHGRFIIDIEKSIVTKFLFPSAELEIENGVIFTDAVSRNYAHFLTEVLPKIFLFSANKENNASSLIIDAGLHQNLVEAIEIVAGVDVDLIGLDIGESVQVKSLHVLSPVGYVPFEKRPGKEALPGHSHGIFSSFALLSMRDHITAKISDLATRPKKLKIFIRRNSEYRNVSNAAEIEKLLVARGFFVIEPEKLSFLEQVEFFANAEVIVGATGAALANLIFCAATTRIVILIARYKHNSYFYWQNMASACGNRVTYVLGESESGPAKTIHSNFYVSPKFLLEALNGYC